MRQSAIRVWSGILMLTLVGNVGLVPARGSDFTGMPANSPSPSATQPSPSSPQGQGKAEHRRETMNRLNKACGEDMKKFCQHVQPGGGRIVQCLEQLQSEISLNCKQWLNKKESQEEISP
jgi:Cysteine rich repeat